MSLLEINVGTFANDGTGDDLREAFRKVNLNFQELDLRDDESTTASNLGATGESVFAQKLNYELQFKKLVAGKDISLTSNDERIVITANGGVKSVLVSSDAGTTLLEEVSNLNVYGGNNIETSLVNNTLTIDFVGTTTLVTDTNPRLGANLDAQGRNISSVGNIDATGVTGNFYGSVYSVTSGLTLVNANTNEINLSSTSISSLKDVSIDTATIQTGQVLVWNGISFVAGDDIDTNLSNLSQLNDVENYTTANIVQGQVLAWNGTKWEPANVSGGGSGYDVSNNFNFGAIYPVVNTVAEFTFYQTEFDFGTFNDPIIINTDLGSI